MNKNDTKGKKNQQKGLVDPKKIKEYEVHQKTPLLEFLFQVMPKEPKKNVKRILANHQVSVGGVPISQFDFTLYPEDIVIVSEYRISKRTTKDLPIIYEDEEIIVINKPSGLLSIASDREKGKTAYRLVSDYITSKNPKDRIFVVHRLDEDTSGVLMFAKSYEIKEAFQSRWNEIVSKRGYYAIVEGHMEKKEDTFIDNLAQNSVQLVYVCKPHQEGKRAITSYKVIKETKDYSLLDVNIDTGRKNQIRVQLGHRGHHIIGDDKYGEPANPIKRLGLHAYSLELTHPFSGKKLKFFAPMPQSFEDLIFSNKKKSAKLSNTRKREEKESKNAVKMRKAKENAQYHKFKKRR
ncbi:MAG: RluA family pseudouridine synthase [Bacillota bacterium]|nr:RluA family pseudouridine synthase [Bacillota bacterium]